MNTVTLSGYDELVRGVITSSDTLVDDDQVVMPTHDSKGNELVCSPDGSIEWILVNDDATPGAFNFQVIDDSDSSTSAPAIVHPTIERTPGAITDPVLGADGWITSQSPDNTQRESVLTADGWEVPPL